MQCPKCGKEAAGDVCAACGAYLTEETPRWYAEGIVHLAGEKQFGMAQELLQEGLQRYPTSSMLWFNAGVLAEMLKKPQDAAAYYQKAYYLKPTSEKYRQALERVLGRPVPRLAPPPQAPAPAAPPPPPIEPAVTAPVEAAAPATVKTEETSSSAALEAQLAALSDQLAAEPPARASEPERVPEEPAGAVMSAPLRLDAPVKSSPSVVLDLAPAPGAPAAEEPAFNADDWPSTPTQVAEKAEPTSLDLTPAAEETLPETKAEALPPEADATAAALDHAASDSPEHVGEEAEAPDDAEPLHSDGEDEVADDVEPPVFPTSVDLAVEPEPAPLEALPESAEPPAPDELAGEHDLMPIAVIPDAEGEPADDLPDEPTAEAGQPVEPLPGQPEPTAATPTVGASAAWPGWRLVRLLTGPLAVLAGLALVVFLFAGKGALFVAALLVFTALVILRFISSALCDHDHHERRR